MIIDFHTHIFPPRIREKRERYLGKDPLFDQLYNNPKAKIATAEELMESMERDGIDISVVLGIGWSNHDLCHEVNDYILESIARYPAKLVGFCTVQPLAGDKALVEVERCIRGGIRGIGELRNDLQGFDLTDKTIVAPLVELAVKHNLIVLTHTSEPVGHYYNGKGTIVPGQLYRFISDYPELTLVCAHWGGGLPFYALMPEVKKALSNVYFDTAASPFLYEDDIFKHVSQIIGAEKILFGSDYPLIKQNRIVRSLASLSIPEEAKRMILGDNARRLLAPG